RQGSCGNLASIHCGPAARQSAASGVLQRADATSERCGGGIDSSCIWICGSGPLDFRNKRGADHCSIRESAKNGNMAGQRNTEADSDRKLCHTAREAQQRGQIIWQSIFGSGDSCARNQVQKSGGTRRNFFQPFGGGSGRTKKNGIETMSSESAAILFRFFRREIGDEHAVGSRGRR